MMRESCNEIPVDVRTKLHRYRLGMQSIAMGYRRLVMRNRIQYCKARSANAGMSLNDYKVLQTPLGDITSAPPSVYSPRHP